MNHTSSSRVPTMACYLVVLCFVITRFNSPASAEDPADEFHTMTVTVLNEAGEPLADANVHVSVWLLDPMQRFPNGDHKTNARGEAEVTLPYRLRILRIWPSKAGYVPLFVNFAEGTHQAGELIPDTYLFQLQIGSQLSGRVVDSDGKPIPNANVQVRVDGTEGNWGTDPKPIVNTWLAEGDDAVMTDADGRWSISNAPAFREGNEYQFRLQITHPEFVGDTRWGELQFEQGITTSQLRDGTAELKLPRGIQIQGKITGPDGEPVTPGLVVWDDNPYFAEGVNEAFIDNEGGYATKHLGPGVYPITVLAPGFAPVQEKVTFSRDTAEDSIIESDFQLQAGNPITLEVVDQDGQPVAEARVQIGTWRGT